MRIPTISIRIPTCIPSSKRLILLATALSVFSQNFIVMVNGFANNLVGTRSGCMIELDTSEVIMNFEVKSPEDSDFPRMHLAVIEEGSNNRIESPYHYKPAGDNGGADDSKTILTVAFMNPYSREEFHNDLQFVIEVFYEDAKPVDDNSIAPAEFVGGGAVGCEHNRRVSARHMDNDGLVKLQINDGTSHLHLVAGWATEHEAVRLTQKLILEPRVDGSEPNAKGMPQGAVGGDSSRRVAPIVVENLDTTKKVNNLQPNEPVGLQGDSNLDAAAADAAADDDGPVKMDDEIQAETRNVKPNKPVEPQGDSNMDAAAADAAADDDRPVKMDDEIQDETRHLGSKRFAEKAVKGAAKRITDVAKKKAIKGETLSDGGTGDETTEHHSNQRQPIRHDRPNPKKMDEFMAVASKINHATKKRAGLKRQQDTSATADSQEMVEDEDEDEVMLPPMKGRSNIFQAHREAIAKQRRNQDNVLKGNKDNDNKPIAVEDEDTQSFRRLYESDDFAGGLHMRGYLFGCLLFILSFGSILFVFGRRREKGRREL